jgi:hypothetical protein
MSRNSSPRRAAVAVELAVVLPFLAFIFVLAVDYSRVLYYTQVITTCARNGALYASDPNGFVASPYASLDAAAKADADTSIQSQITVSSTSGTDAVGNWVQITVSYPFTTIANYPGIPQTTTITRTAFVRPAPSVPTP